MDWLIKNQAIIECSTRKLKFKDYFNREAIVCGDRATPTLHIISATKLIKYYRKKHTIYGVKINLVEKSSMGNEPERLADF